MTLPAVRGRAEFVIEWQSIADREIVFATVECTDFTTAQERIGGTHRNLEVDEGDVVTREQRIATVEDAKLSQALAAFQAQIGALGERVHFDAVDLERIQALRVRNTMSQARLDEAQATFDALTGELATSEAEREVARQRLKKADVLAPATGRGLRCRPSMAPSSCWVRRSRPWLTKLMCCGSATQAACALIQLGEEVLVGQGVLAATDCEKRSVSS